MIVDAAMKWLILLGAVATASAKPVTKIDHGEWSAAVASPDGAWVAYWSDDGMVNLLDVTRRAVAHRVLPASYSPGYSIAWAPDSRRLAYTTDAGLEVYDLDRDATR